MQTALSSHAGFFVAAEGAGWVELVVGVCPDHAGSKFRGDLENLGTFVRPDAAGEAVGRVVGFFDRFRGRAEGLNRDDRAEDFFLCDAMRLRRVEEKRRAAEISGAGKIAGTFCQSCAPSSWPIWRYCWIFSSCIFELIAPMSVFLSSGSPTIRVCMRSCSFRRTDL